MSDEMNATENNNPSTADQPQVPKLAKTRDLISLLSTTVPVIGFAGTIFVWMAANFYVGTIDVHPNVEYKNLVVHVYDKKGQETTFNTPRFQLMPGRYHVAVVVDDKAPHHLDTDVVVGKTAVIPIEETLSATADQVSNAGGTPGSTASENNAALPAVRKHWWQFWKRTDPNDKVDDSGIE